MTWRGKREPLTCAEVGQLNKLLPSVGFKISDLQDPDYLGTLAGSPIARRQPCPSVTRSTGASRTGGFGQSPAGSFGARRADARLCL